MPHHKGRKRFHLGMPPPPPPPPSLFTHCVRTELYETVENVGASMKHYVVEGMRNMWQQLNELARSHRSPGDQPPLPQEEPDTPTGKPHPLVSEVLYA